MYPQDLALAIRPSRLPSRKYLFKMVTLLRCYLCCSLINILAVISPHPLIAPKLWKTLSDWRSRTSKNKLFPSGSTGPSMIPMAPPGTGSGSSKKTDKTSLAFSTASSFGSNGSGNPPEVCCCCRFCCAAVVVVAVVVRLCRRRRSNERYQRSTPPPPRPL